MAEHALREQTRQVIGPDLARPGPFRFMTQTGVVCWAGFMADDLRSLLLGVQRVPDASIYYHVHHAVFQRPRYTWAEYTNDFARWALSVLGQKGLAERLAAVDPLECPSLRLCRERLKGCVQEYVAEAEVFPRVPAGREFYFLEARSFALPADIEANSPGELAQGIARLGAGCIMYHFIQTRFLDGGTNDFSRWLRLTGHEAKAVELDRLNPYFHDLGALQEQILKVLLA